MVYADMSRPHTGLLEDIECDICIVDADSVAQGRNGVANARLILSAVQTLQGQGFNTILLSQQDMWKYMDLAAVDRKALKLVKVPNGPDDLHLQLLQHARDYCCPFVTNADIGALEDDWRVPRPLKQWLREKRSILHAQFAFNSEWHFGAKFSQQVRWGLQARGGAGARSQEAWGMPPGPAGAPGSSAFPPPGPPAAGNWCHPPAANSASGSSPAPVMWSPGEARWDAPPQGEPSRGVSHSSTPATSTATARRSPHAQQPPPQAASQAVSPPPPPGPPPASGCGPRPSAAPPPPSPAPPPGLQEPPHNPEAFLGSSRESGAPALPVDGSHTSKVSLVEVDGTQVICLFCEQLSSWLFPSALHLAESIVNAESFEETDLTEEDATFRVQLQDQGMHWACDLCTVTSVQGGANHNLKAFGFGSNAKARKRAGRLALAAFVRAQSAETRIEDPTETGDFQQLVDYVRQLSQGGGAADGRAPWWQEMSTEVEQQPALEAPPPTSSTAASWLLQAEVAPPAPARPRRQLPEQPPAPPNKPAFLFPPPPPPRCRPGEEEPRARHASQPSDSRSWLAGNDTGGPPDVPAIRQQPVQRPAMHGRTGTASMAYDAEGTGYLSFKKDDRIQVLHEKIAEGTEQDVFAAYLYGKNLARPHEEAGWFPLDIVRFVDPGNSVNPEIEC